MLMAIELGDTMTRRFAAGFCAGLTLLLFTTGLAAGTDRARHQAPAGSVPPVTAPTMAQLIEFFEGTWGLDDGISFERWQKSDDGALAGRAYRLEANEERISERLQIRSVDGRFAYLATVLNQNAGATIPFELVAFTGQECVFENPAHDFPKKILYRKESPEKMFVEVSGDGRRFSFTMTKR